MTFGLFFNPFEKKQTDDSKTDRNSSKVTYSSDEEYFSSRDPYSDYKTTKESFISGQGFLSCSARSILKDKLEQAELAEGFKTEESLVA